MRPTRSDSWLRNHIDWDQWYRYHAVAEAVRHYDFGATSSHFKNRGWHFKPADGSPLGLLRIIPHDHNGSWYQGYHDTLNSSGTSIGTDYAWWAIFGDRARPPAGSEKTAFTIEYRNFIREFRQLLWQEETVHGMLDDLASELREFSYADRDRWTGGPAAAGTENTVDIDSLVNGMKEFAFVEDTYLGATLSGGRGKFLDNLAADSAIPNTPTISYSGSSGFPSGGLVFSSSNFSDPQGSGTFAKMRWRIAEVGGGSNVPLAVSGNLWKFFDQGTDPGVDWRAKGFNDSTWSEGPSQLGWGESDQATDVPGRHITTYFRRSFSVIDPSLFASLEGGVIRDDGVIIYLNGQEIYRSNMPTSGTIDFMTPASGVATGAGEGDFQPFSAAASLLVVGENVIAVEIHQRVSSSGAVSGDMSFDLFLNGILNVEEERKFEWNAVWESGELDTFNSSIAPPASATREGRRYRARVQHADSSGRWSKWSDPVEFVAGATDLTVYQDSLVISEVMYHSVAPSSAEIAAGFDDDDDFDYIELRNIGDSTIDLSDVRFTKGVDFDFVDGSINQLAPGGFVLVVSNQDAFEMRYGTGFPIAGEWSGRLKNSSELIKLSFGAGLSLKEMTYADTSPWPEEADGNGVSLSLVDPLSNPSTGLVFNWRPSSVSPGQSGTTTFAGGTAEDFLEYATGLLSPDFTLLASGHIEFTVTVNRAAGDVIGFIQSSGNLTGWDDAESDFEIIEVENLSQGYGRVKFRSMAPRDDQKPFFRYFVRER